ncbi:glycosyltransferase [Mycolicibacterium sp. Y3]
MQLPSPRPDARLCRPDDDRPSRRVLLVGAGFRFLGGLSAYTCALANTLAEDRHVSVLLIDRLIPTRLYPGSARVGQHLTALSYDNRVTIAGTLDWYWGPAIRQLPNRIRAVRPDVIVLQWWTAATLHTYLLISAVARRNRIPVVIEFHEVQDTGEVKVPLVARYCRLFLRRLVREASGAIFHNLHDRELIARNLGSEFVERLPARVAPHGPYDHLAKRSAGEGVLPHCGKDDGPTRVLFFGLIRPYKGVEDLVAAIDQMTDEQVGRLEVDIVGETWENWNAPADAIRASRHRERIRFDNRYVSDAEAADYFANADVLVLPYRRASASGALEAAMSNGIPVILYAVGGLVEAVSDYPGAILVPPKDISALSQAIVDVSRKSRERFVNPHTWEPLRAAIDAFAEAGHL